MDQTSKHNLLFLMLKSARPWQWVKNFFVFAPLIFAKLLFNQAAFLKTVSTFFAFSFISSATYIFNDIKDRQKDALHPVKKFRPVASGQLDLNHAATASVLFLAAGFLLGFSVSTATATVLIAYILLNILYTLKSKHIPYVDILSISSGFLLRIAAGAFAINVEISFWIMMNTFLLSSYLGFGKRFHEIITIKEQTEEIRPVLKHYDPSVLDSLMLLVLFLIPLAFTGYIFYPASGNNIQYKLFTTFPFMLLGLYRFYKLASDDEITESPTESMLKDKIFVISVTLWTTGAIYSVYL